MALSALNLTVLAKTEGSTASHSLTVMCLKLSDLYCGLALDTRRLNAIMLMLTLASDSVLANSRLLATRILRKKGNTRLSYRLCDELEIN